MEFRRIGALHLAGILLGMAVLLAPVGGAVAENEKAWNVGDRVEVYWHGWATGVIKEVGSGDYAGMYRLDLDKYQSAPWVKSKYVRALPDTQAEEKKTLSSTSLLGQFECGVFLRGSYIISMHFTLNQNGTYQLEGGGKGRYSNNAARKRVDFLSGDLKEMVGRIAAEPKLHRQILYINKKSDLTKSQTEQDWSAQTCSPTK